MSPDVKKKDFGFWYYLSLIGQLGLVMASSILLGLGFGMFLDSKLGSAPVGLVVCLLMGILAAFVSAWQMLSKRL